MSRFTSDQLAAYQTDGFFVARQLFAGDEIVNDRSLDLDRLAAQKGR